MSLEQLTLSDEQVQDIVGSLINGSSNADVVYDDVNDTLTVSLTDSISVNTLEADTLIGADVQNATSGSVPVSQGNGSLAMGAVGHVTVEATGPFGTPKGSQSKASLSTNRRHHGVSALDGLVYAVGGDSGSTLASVEEYDPDTDTWTAVSSLNTARERHGTAATSTNLYAMGGFDSNTDEVSSVEKYDPTNNTWTSVSSLKQNKIQLSASAKNDFVYAIGGRDGDFNVLSEVEKYDQSADSWSTVASLNTARRSHTSSTAGGVYAIGGENSSGTIISSVEEYDPNNNTWSTVASLNTARVSLASAAINGFVYAISGRDPNGDLVTPIEEYDPANDTWQNVIDINTPRQLHGATSADFVYTVGGSDNLSNILGSTEELVFNKQLEDVVTLNEDTLIGIDDRNALLENSNTNRQINPNFAQSGETIRAFSDTNARLYRTEKS